MKVPVSAHPGRAFMWLGVLAAAVIVTARIGEYLLIWNADGLNTTMSQLRSDVIGLVLLALFLGLFGAFVLGLWKFGQKIWSWLGRPRATSEPLPTHGRFRNK